jgi:site-specific DNA-methyltransferase (adenine-specific)
VSLYYDDGNGIQIYHGDSLEILPTVRADALVTDPPYGIGADRNLRANKRHGSAVTESNDYGGGNWDTSRFEGLEAIAYSFDESIVWGGNYYDFAPSPAWLVWDKDNGNNGYADCELAWTNLDQAVRRKRYRWMGMLQEHGGVGKEERVHPTQKPLAIMIWCLGFLKSQGTILDPFMGSGTTLVAAKQLGRKAIGIEISREYCDVAIKRLQQEVLDFSPKPKREPEQASILDRIGKEPR